MLVRVDQVPETAHVVDRHHDLELERLASSGIGDRHLAVRTDSAQEGGDGAQGALRSGKADSLRSGMPGGGDQRLEALQGKREVRSALGGREGVHLVDDDVLHSPQHLPSLAGEQQVEAFGGRYQDLGRIPGERPSRIRRRVAGA